MPTLGRGANKEAQWAPHPTFIFWGPDWRFSCKQARENANPAISVTVVTVVVLPITDPSWSQLQSLLRGDLTSCQDSVKSFWGDVLPLRFVLGFSLREIPIVG